MINMSLQTISQLILVIGILLTAAGTFGAYYFGQQEDNKKEFLANLKQGELKKELLELKASNAQIHSNIELLIKTAGVSRVSETSPKAPKEIWQEVETNHVPPGVTAYLLLLFKSDKGRIIGRARVKGTTDIYTFSTTANDEIPVAVRNLWMPKEGSYKIPTVLEFQITEKTEPDALLSIYTQGWIDSLGQEPH